MRREGHGAFEPPPLAPGADLRRFGIAVCVLTLSWFGGGGGCAHGTPPSFGPGARRHDDG